MYIYALVKPCEGLCNTGSLHFVWTAVRLLLMVLSSIVHASCYFRKHWIKDIDIESNAFGTPLSLFKKLCLEFRLCKGPSLRNFLSQYDLTKNKTRTFLAFIFCQRRDNPRMGCFKLSRGKTSKNLIFGKLIVLLCTLLRRIFHENTQRAKIARVRSTYHV